jgi:hypothetical protein
MEKKEIIQNNDYIFGKNNENKLFNIIKNNFDMNLKQTEYKYNLFDFISDKFIIEMKSRRVNADTYNEVFISYNKITNFINSINYNKKKLILIFNFLDKIKYIIYDKNLFDTFKINIQNTRNDYNKIDKVIFIPNIYLIELKE